MATKIPSTYKKCQRVLVKNDTVIGFWNGQFQYQKYVAEIVEVHADGYTVRNSNTQQNVRVAKKQIHCKYEG